MKDEETHERLLLWGTVRPGERRTHEDGAAQARADQQRARQKGEYHQDRAWSGSAGRAGQAAEGSRGSRRAEEGPTELDGAVTEPEMAKRLLKGL